MNYPLPTIKAITDFIFIGAEAKELSPSDLVIVLGNHIIDIMMGEVAMLFCSGELPCMRQSWLSGRETSIFWSGRPGGRNIAKDAWWESEVSVKRVMAEVERIGKYYATGNMSIW